MLGEMNAGGRVRVEATPDQLDAICKIARVKGSSVAASETSPDGRPVLIIQKN